MMLAVTYPQISLHWPLSAEMCYMLNCNTLKTIHVVKLPYFV